jgi:PiT family inorganic phosphate transporter
MELVSFILVLALAYANGTNDVSKAIATLVGSGVTNYRVAILWGTRWTMIGAGTAAFVAGAMVKTFSQGLVQTGTIIPPTVTMAVLAGTMTWVLLASRTGLPVSTTQALTGAIVGAGLAALAGGALLCLQCSKRSPYRCFSAPSSPSRSPISFIPSCGCSPHAGKAPACASYRRPRIGRY